jgi:hypothetical protein
LIHLAPPFEFNLSIARGESLILKLDRRNMPQSVSPFPERRFFVSYLPTPYFETQLSFFNNPGSRADKGRFRKEVVSGK